MGVFDLIGIHPDINTALCIQVKSNRLPAKQERERLLAFLVPNYCAKLIWIVFDGKPRKPQIYICNKELIEVPYELYLKEG